MIATSNINLKVPFNEKDQAKSLGARWNAEAKVWYVPQGVDAAPFEKWLSSVPNTSPNNASNNVPNNAPAAAVNSSATSTVKPNVKPMTQANKSTNKPLADDLDAINASLRDAYEPNEDAEF